MMAKLDAAPEVIGMASDLELDSRRPVQAIVAFCRSKISAWVKKAGGARSIAQVQEVVCRNLGLVLEEVRSDEDVEVLAEKYVAMGEKVFASLSMQLDEDKFATVMRREHAGPKAPDRYVSVIDCRGKKSARRFFTRWHEIAHILTLVTQKQLPFQKFRSVGQGDPIERLMDVIAGEVGFYEPVFEPALSAELRNTGYITFNGVERIRQAVCSEASFQATLIACAKRAPTPVIHLEAEMAYKKCEEIELASRQLRMFDSPKPQAKLRAVSAVQNAAAKKANFRIHPNMQIPDDSLISVHHDETKNIETSLGVSGTESLSNWQCSDGTTLGDALVHVEVRKQAGVLFALVQPK